MIVTFPFKFERSDSFNNSVAGKSVSELVFVDDELQADSKNTTHNVKNTPFLRTMGASLNNHERSNVDFGNNLAQHPNDFKKPMDFIHSNIRTSFISIVLPESCPADDVVVSKAP